MSTFVLAAVAALAVVAGLVLARSRQPLTHWLEGLFRRPPKPPKPPAADHYYRPYWS